jgi:hypothetical protein
MVLECQCECSSKVAIYCGKLLGIQIYESYAHFESFSLSLYAKFDLFEG